MILPGISGSFILVLLGKYFYIMEAVKTFNVPVMLVFIGGAAIGITTFSRVLSFALRKFHDITIAVLAGFMLGSLNKVWPWKETIETYESVCLGGRRIDDLRFRDRIFPRKALTKKR